MSPPFHGRERHLPQPIEESRSSRQGSGRAKRTSRGPVTSTDLQDVDTGTGTGIGSGSGSGSGTGRSSTAAIRHENGDSGSRSTTNSSTSTIITDDRVAGAGKSSPRRVLPQPIETVISGSRRAGQHGRHHSDGTARHGPASSHARADSSLDKSPSASTSPRPITSETSTPSPPTRRFAPQMIETSRRSRRNTDTSIGAPEIDQTDHTPEPQDYLPPHMRRRQSRPGCHPVPPDNSPAVSTDEVPTLPPESRYSAAKLAERQQTRRHSFRVPSLPAITSTSEETEEDSSNASDPLSVTTSVSTVTSERTDHKYRRARLAGISARESQDERFSGYLLTLAASAAEAQLRDQAMAAYPNEMVHEPVDHYAGDRDSDRDSDMEEHIGRLDMESSDRTINNEHQSRRHRDSGAGWDLEQMRQHQARLEQQKEQAWAADAAASNDTGWSRQHPAQAGLAEGGPPPPDQASVPQAMATHRQHHANANVSKGAGVGWQKDNEIYPQRKAASPPMAGGDLKFPKCLSPQATRLDVHQWPGQKRSSDEHSRQHTGLWTPGGGASRKASQTGLWMGVNAASAQQVTTARAIQNGLLTPAFDRHEYFQHQSSAASSRQSSASPTRIQALHNIKSDTTSSTLRLPPASPLQYHQQHDGKSHNQRQHLPPTPPATAQSTHHPHVPNGNILASEFPSSFITQLYNYLSLGYPTLARPYDPELSRITSISIDTLRRDDKKCNARGYIDEDDEDNDTDDEDEDDDPALADPGRKRRCERWKALRQYVWEWGRQQRIADSTSASAATTATANDAGRDSRPATGDSEQRYGDDDDETGLEHLDVQGLLLYGGHGQRVGMGGRKGSWGW